MIGLTLNAELQSNTSIYDSPMEHLVANALHHSFLLATRNLCGFFFSRRPRTDDIVAEDFFDTPDGWKKRRPACLPEFENGSLADMIGKRLLHLTYKRAEGTKQTWCGFRIAWELLKPLEVSVATVSPERLSEELVQDTETMRGDLQPYVDTCGSVDAIERAPLVMLWAKEDFWRNPRRVDSESDEETC